MAAAADITGLHPLRRMPRHGYWRFVQNLVVQRRMRDAHMSLRGRVLTTLHAAGEDKIQLASVDDLVAALHEKFGLNVPEAATLWPAICARHEAVFKDS